MEKNPWICGECRSTVSTRFAPAVATRSARRRAVMEMRGSSFLSLRAYGKYGRTAVTRRAEACVSASSRINSSTMFSDSGGADVCTTNTSSSRTFSSIRTLRFSFEKRVVESRPGAMPRHLQIAWASAGCDDPEKTLRPSISAAHTAPPSWTGQAARGDTHQLKAGRRLPALAAWIDGHPLRAKGDVESERGAFCMLAKIGKERAQRIDFDIEPAPLDDGNIGDRRPYRLFGVAFYDKDETGALTYLESVLGNHARSHKVPSLVGDELALDLFDELLTGSFWPESSIDQVFHRAFSHLPPPLTVRMDRPHSCPWRSCQQGC